MSRNIAIQPCASVAQRGWLEMRQALWPGAPNGEHLSQMESQIADQHRYGQFVAYSDTGKPIGFAEVSLRSDYVNGTYSSPVAFLEGIYVIPEARRHGVARSLLAEVDRWARSAGCQELASDALLENQMSHAMHRALGFEETERVVFYRKSLG